MVMAWNGIVNDYRRLPQGTYATRAMWWRHGMKRIFVLLAFFAATGQSASKAELD